MWTNGCYLDNDSGNYSDYELTWRLMTFLEKVNGPEYQRIRDDNWDILQLGATFDEAMEFDNPMYLWDEIIAAINEKAPEGKQFGQYAESFAFGVYSVDKEGNRIED